MIKITMYVSRNDGKPLTDFEKKCLHQKAVESVDVSEYLVIDGIETIDESKFINDAV